jgi:AraC family transcriptional activator of tynA and feaB
MLQAVLGSPAAAGEPTDRWHRKLRDAFGIDYRVEPQSASFELASARYRLGPVQFVVVDGGPCLLEREADPSRSMIFIAIPLEGICLYREGGSEAQLTPGSICLCRARRAAQVEWPGRFRTAVIAVCENRLSEICPQWARLAVMPLARSDGALAIFIDTVKSLLSHTPAFSSPAADHLADPLLGLLGAALNELANEEGTAESRLEAYHKSKIHQFIRAELSNPELDIPLIAQAVGLSARYVHRLFADEPLHLMQYVWAQRLDNCYRELTQGGSERRPISNIAFAWGFNDPAHFSRAFRKRFGQSPSDVRQKLRGQQLRA